MKKLLTMVTLVGAGLVLTTSAVNAYRGDVTVKGPNYTPERHEAMTQAFENKDYSAWKEVVADRPIAEKIDETEFEKFAQMHQLRLEGKTDEANQIRAELGLGLRNGSGRGNGQGKGRK